MALGHNPSITTSNLLWCIDSGNPRSYPGTGTTWIDAMTTTNGTLTNSPTYTSGTPGGYFSFDGVDDYVNMGSSVNLAQNFTLEIWCYITGDGCGLFGQGIYAGSQGLHILWNTAGSRGMIFGMYGNDLDTPSYSLTFNAWHQFCFTYNNSTYLKQFYADGSLINSGTGSAWAGSGQFNVGMIYSAPGNTTMKGRISTARMYNAVLTASQVTQNFNAQRGRYGI
jgi:hypothetical protein